MKYVNVITDTEENNAIVAVVDRTKVDAWEFMVNELMVTMGHNLNDAREIVKNKYHFSIQPVEQRMRTKKKK